MIHFEVDPATLQADVPYKLDLWHGRAFVTLVPFTMSGLRFHAGGKLGAWLLRPIATHEFLNVRTYVQHDHLTGIHFLVEWISNRLAVTLGPTTFSLPYRYGRIHYKHPLDTGALHGHVEDATTGHAFSYAARFDPGQSFARCPPGSLTEWLMERYHAFNSAHDRLRAFQVWHAPWMQAPAQCDLMDTSALTANWPWFRNALLIGANFSPGLQNVTIGWPRRINAEEEGDLNASVHLCH